MGPPSCLHHPAFGTEQAVRDTHPSKRLKQLVRSLHILDGLLILIGCKALLFPFVVCYNDRENRIMRAGASGASLIWRPSAASTFASYRLSCIKCVCMHRGPA